MHRWYLALLTLLLPGVVLTQETKPDQPEAAALLREVAANYAHAEQANIHVEMVEESVRTNELQRDWRKRYRTMIRGSGNRFRLETRAAYGSWVEVSDGKTEWIYWVNAKRYVQHPMEGTRPTRYRGIFGDNQELGYTWDIATQLESWAVDSRNAAYLREETIALEGRNFPCYVVGAQLDNNNISSTYTFWIEKESHIFRKIVTHRNIHGLEGDPGGFHVSFVEDETATFPIFDLNSVTPDSVFQFVPPAEAKLVDHLEPEWAREVPPTPARTKISPEPDIQLTDSTGKIVPLRSYRGKPLLIDLWATWCGPCLVSMPDFGKIADEYRDYGLVTISIDEDTEPQAPLDYVKRHGFGWTNYHDIHDAALHALQGNAIPMVVLIDKDGNVVFRDNTGDYDAALHALLTKMFPAKKAR
jgi:thiol-disulfide isomerase/thioredoxin